jgi:hypothetical protein
MFLSVSLHIPGHTVFGSHCPLFSGFSPYSRSYPLHFISHVFIVSCHIPGPTVCISHFPCFECFSPNSRS